MKRRLTLKTERLTVLTEDELMQAGGAGVNEQATGRPDCILSIDRCFTNVFCTVFCPIQTR